MLYTANGTYDLPNNNDFNATVSPGLTSVTFILSDAAASSYNISSNTGSTVSINAVSSTTAFLNVDTNGGDITLGLGLVNQLITVNATISGGGTYTIPDSLLNSLNGGSINFSSGGGTELLGDTSTTSNLSTAAIVYGFTTPNSDIIDDKALTFSDFSQYVIGGINGSGQQSITLDSGNGSTLSFTVFGAHLAPGVYHSTSTGPLLLTADASGGTQFTPQVVCFARGTRVGTPQGETAVEDLRIGDLVNASFSPDAERTPQLVKWLGYRRIDLKEHPRPDMVAPIRIRNSAFADGVPHRDLLVSPDHAILVDGMLISARQLLNGVTIRREENWRSVEYFHVELDRHAVMTAEGLAVESYLDTGNRGFFASSSDPLVLHPDFETGSRLPALEPSCCAEFVTDGGRVQPVWRRLTDRAAVLEETVTARDTTAHADLHILVDGRAIRPISMEEGLFTFVLPRKASRVQVISRACTPSDTRPWLDDRRHLGVYVERIVLRDRIDVTEIPLDHPALSKGWWDIEHNGIAMRRWTDGAAVLPLPAFDGPGMLDIRASNGGMIYLSDTQPEPLAAIA
jgi:hypothetical protein